MRQYELTYLVSDNVSESEITKVTGKIGGYISDEGGKILKEESWGRRKLAYPINKQLFATYVTTNFELEPEKLRAFEQEIKHTNDAIRYLLIVKNIGKEELTLTAGDITATEEIKEVIGGEKSFEVVEGMTDESKDLMAVRGDDKDIKESKSLKTEKQVKEAKKEPEKIVEDKSAVKKTTKKAEPKIEKIIESAADGKPEARSSKLKAADKSVKKKAVKKDDSVSDEADRLAKLNQELDEILGEDL